MRLGAPDSPAEVQMKTVGRCAAAPKRAGAVQMQDRHCCSSTSPHAELNDQGEVAAVVLAALDLGWWRDGRPTERVGADLAATAKPAFW